MNHDATHCSDYDDLKCPPSCYRAQLTEDLAKNHKAFVGIPLSYASFLGTIECDRANMPKTEAMQILDQMENVLIACDKPDAQDRTPTMKAFLVLARAVYFLLNKYVREKHK